MPKGKNLHKKMALTRRASRQSTTASTFKRKYAANACSRQRARAKRLAKAREKESEDASARPRP